MKHFLTKLLYTVLPLWLALIGWYLYYNMHLMEGISGEIGPLAQIYFGKEYDHLMGENVPYSFYYNNVTQKDSIHALRGATLSVGDSFSQYGRFIYLNYLGRHGIPLYGYTSATGAIFDNPIQKAWELLKLGYVDSANVQTLIVESVERTFLRRLYLMDLNSTELKDEDRTQETPWRKWTLIQPIDFIAKNSGLKHTSIKHARLAQSLFTHDKYAQDLFFYSADVTEDMSVDTLNLNLRLAVDNLRELYKLAGQKGVRLMVVVPPDKYDLYQSFIVDNPFPPKTINEDLRRLFPDEENLVLCKEFLLPHVQRGEKDIYMLNDTHWSPKTAKIVADELYMMLN